MSNQKSVIEFIKQISGQANILTIPRIYISLVRSHRTALFLSQCIYWSDKGGSGDGWFYKSFSEWKSELGLNQHAITTCVKKLKEIGLVETRLAKEPNGVRLITWYRADIQALAAMLSETTLAETAKVPYRKTITSSIPHRLQQRKPRAARATSSTSGERSAYDGYTPDD